MKKILILVSSLTFGGAQKQIVSLVNYMNREKIEIKLGYFVDDSALVPQIDKKYLKNIVCLEKRKKVDHNVLRKLKAVIDNNVFDHVLCVNQYTMFYAYVLKKLFNYKYGIVVMMHTTTFSTLYSKIKNIVYKKIMNKCDNVLFVCSNQMRHWIRVHNIDKRKCHFIYNGIDIERFCDNFSNNEKKYLKKSLGIGLDENVIGICAALRPEKKHEDLILATKKLLLSGIKLKIKILIIGDGARRKALESYVKEQRMENNVTITGFQDDVRPYISICDIMVIASHSVETFSIAILESMAMAKEIIATDVGGASEMIEESVNGYLYKPGDVYALALKLKYSLENRIYKKLGQESRRKVVEKFTIRKMISEYEKYILRI